MKVGGRLLLLVCAVAALLALPATASGKAPELKISNFEIEGSNGYGVGVSAVREGRFPDTAVVFAENGPLWASYEVPMDAAPGIHATFESLGQLDVSFERRRREIDRPEKGCRLIAEEGIFRGSFRFVGEGGYFSSETIDPEGEVLRLPNGFCGFGSFRRARPFLGLESKTLEAQARSDGQFISFRASKEEFVRFISFRASLRERVGEMKILRTASTRGRERAFSSSGSARASVHPPPPFSGNAKFEKTAAGSVSWTGSLSVSFPGAPETALAGEAFTAKLCPKLSILSRCLKGRAVRASSAAALYGSGSHSQPLALARLSSLR